VNRARAAAVLPLFAGLPVLVQCGTARLVVFRDGRAYLEIATGRGPAWLETTVAELRQLAEVAGQPVGEGGSVCPG
jgi:hypothetical protein